MPRSSRRNRDDSESSDEGRHGRDRSRSRSVSPPKEKRAKRRDSSPPPPADDGETAGGEGGEISLSIEETNKLRAQLGLAPLDTDDSKPKIRDGEDGVKIINEYGIDIHHKVAENWAEKKRDKEIKEKLEEARRKRMLHEKLLKNSGLADSDDEEDASGWVEKLRKQEEEKKQAAERERILAEMEAQAESEEPVKREKKRDGPKKPRSQRERDADTGGLIIGHSKEAFYNMQDQVLVLEDKSVLDEGDETLVNVNMIDDERYKKNVELRRKRNPYENTYADNVDEFGNPKSSLLSKYDEELEGSKKETFRLDEKGEFDLSKEEREAKIRQELEMAGRQLVSLDTPDLKVSSDFYTQEEMIAFRRPKKVKKDKLRKRGKTLKADDLVPDEPAGSSLGSRDRGRRRPAEEGDGEKEQEQMETDEKAPKTEEEEGDKRWKKTMQASVDVEKLRKLATTIDDDDSDEDEFGHTDLTGIVIDDDAEDELSAALSRTRKVKQERPMESSGADYILQMMEKNGGVKMEVDSDEEQIKEEEPEGVLSFDSTREYCRNIGENLTYGLAGNRKDAVDTPQQELEPETSAVSRWKEAQREKEHKKRKEKKKEESKGGWLKAGDDDASHIDSDDERELEEARKKVYSSSESEDEEDEHDKYENVLGKEADVSKGVGAMLKLAAQKGYLSDPNSMKKQGMNLDHLKNKAKTQIDGGKYDIEDKYQKKLERIGTTGRGPILPFNEKKDYKPDVVIEYVDNKGRLMEAKDAYRELSYKFHGRNPGKRKTEKSMAKRDKKEKLKMMNSSDTPLGTLSKQLKKSEMLQTPYIVLSGTGRSDHTTIKKE